MFMELIKCEDIYTINLKQVNARKQGANASECEKGDSELDLYVQFGDQELPKPEERTEAQKTLILNLEPQKDSF